MFSSSDGKGLSALKQAETKSFHAHYDTQTQLFKAQFFASVSKTQENGKGLLTLLVLQGV